MSGGFSVNNKIVPVDRFRNKFNSEYTYLNRNMLMGVHDSSFLDGFNVDGVKYSFYPQMEEIYELLSKYLGVDESSLLVTRGSEGSFATLLSVFDFDCCLYTEPSYKMYDIQLQANGVNSIQVDSNDMNIHTIQNNPKIDLVCIVNPNPYYDHYISHNELSGIILYCQTNGITVFLDEIYAGYGAGSYLNSYPIAQYGIDDHENLFVSNSFSKSHMLPSLKLGYLITTSHNQKYLHSNRLSYEISMLDCEFLKHVLKSSDYFGKFRKDVLSKRQYFLDNYLCSSKYLFNIYFDGVDSERFIDENIIVYSYDDSVYFSVPMDVKIHDRIIMALSNK